MLNPLSLTAGSYLTLSKIKTCDQSNLTAVLTLKIMDLLSKVGEKSGQELVPLSQTMPYTEVLTHALLHLVSVGIGAQYPKKKKKT